MELTIYIDKASIESLYERWKKTKEEVDTGWPWPLSAVQEFFEDMYNLIVNAPKRIWEFIEKHLVDPLKGWFSNIAKELKEVFSDVIKRTEESLKDVKEPWKWILYPLVFTANLAWETVGKPITMLIQGALNSVADVINKIFGPIVKPIQDFFSKVWDFFTKDVPKAIFDTFTTAWTSVLEAARSVYEWISYHLYPTLVGGLNWLYDKARGLFESFFRMMVHVIQRAKDHFAKGNIAAGMAELTPLFGLAFTAFLAVDIASIKFVGTGLDLSGVKEVLRQMFDLKLITSIVVGLLTENAIKVPLGYWANETFRPNIPSLSDAVGFWAKGLVDDKFVYRIGAMQGYADDYIKLYMDAAYKDPSFQMVFTAYVRGVIDEADYKKWLSILNIKDTPWRGLKVPDVKIFEEATYRMPSFFTLYYLVETGGVSEQQIKQFLKDMLLHPKYIDLVAKSLLYRAVKGEIERVASALSKAYSRGILTRDRFTEELKSLGKTDDEIKYIVRASEIFRLINDLEELLNIYEYMYKRGLITEDEFLNNLAAKGFDREYLKTRLEVLKLYRERKEEIEEIKDERARYASTLERLLKYGIVSEQEFRDILKKLQFTDKEIELRIERVRKEYQLELVDKKLDLLRAQLMKGIISKDEYVQQCTQLGVDKDLCEALGELYSVMYKKVERRDVTKDERNALARVYEKLFKLGYLSEEKLKEKLKELQFTEDEIALRLEKAKAEYDAEIKDLWIQYYVELFKRGEIDADSFEAALKNLGVSEDKAKVLRQYYEERFKRVERVDLTKDDRRALASVLIKLYQRGAIPRDELAKRLVELGFSDEEINYILERADREYKEMINETKLEILREEMRQGIITKEDFIQNCVALGYSHEKCSVLAELYWTKYIGVDSLVITRDERKSLASTYIKLFKEGLFTEDELRKRLEALRFSKEEIEYMVQKAKLEAFWEIISYQLAYYDELLAKGAISEEEYVQKLSEMGIREEVARARAMKVLRKVKAKELLQQLGLS